MSSAAIIGAGSVGSTIASFLIWGGAYEEIIMIDINKERCEGEVMDLQDAGFLTDTQVRMGEYKDASSASIVIITAGAKQRKGETREALLQRNVRILSSIAKSILPVKDDTLVLLVANPVDILTQLFQEISGIPRERVFGSGTFLDTMRLRTELSMRYNIAATHIHTYIVGMHGDLQIPLWGVGNVASVPVEEFFRLTEKDKKAIGDAARDKAYKIISAKGSTYYGIGACVAKLSAGFTQNRHQIYQLSTWHPQYGCYLSWPAVVSKKGVSGIVPVALTVKETEIVKKAAATIRFGVKNALNPKKSKL
uniref:L-lactate dehydrogenase n=1 Tax=Lotharella globosa TaxID=91324 RepID=A0A6V3J820_9EUKA